MVNGEELIYTLPQELVDKILPLVTILKALGIFIILYIIFSIINAILSRKKTKEIRRINENLEKIKGMLKKK